MRVVRAVLTRCLARSSPLPVATYKKIVRVQYTIPSHVSPEAQDLIRKVRDSVGAGIGLIRIKVNGNAEDLEADPSSLFLLYIPDGQIVTADSCCATSRKIDYRSPRWRNIRGSKSTRNGTAPGRDRLHRQDGLPPRLRLQRRHRQAMTTIRIIPVGRCRFKESPQSKSKRGSRLALVWRSLQSP